MGRPQSCVSEAVALGNSANRGVRRSFVFESVAPTFDVNLNDGCVLIRETDWK